MIMQFVQKFYCDTGKVFRRCQPRDVLSHAIDLIQFEQLPFQLTEDLLERAFYRTYGLKLEDVFHHLDLALGTYRYSISQLIPEMTKAAWSAKKKEIQRLDASMNRKKFVYRMSRASYHKEWDRQYEKPGLGARFLGFLLRIIPKIGPFKALGFKVPPPEGEKLFIASFNDTMERYGKLLADAKESRVQLPNENFDTGRPTLRGAYRMADETYAKLLEHLEGAAGSISNELRSDILDFYKGSDGPESEKARSVLAALRSTQ